MRVLIELEQGDAARLKEFLIDLMKLRQLSTHDAAVVGRLRLALTKACPKDGA